MKTILTILTILGMGFLTPVLHSQDEEQPSPYVKPDESWISLSGTVTSTNPDSFNLDYGDGIVLVEMDDWDIESEGYKLLEGDKVTVNGRVDDDLFETTTIEASSVWVEGLSTYFFASSVDEESLPSRLDPESDLQLRGTVTQVDGREFTIDTGERKMVVDTILMPYNPMDDEGYQKVEVGDRVSVTGDINIDWWETRELQADYVITLSDQSETSS